MIFVSLQCLYSESPRLFSTRTGWGLFLTSFSFLNFLLTYISLAGLIFVFIFSLAKSRKMIAICTGLGVLIFSICLVLNVFFLTRITIFDILSSTEANYHVPPNMVLENPKTKENVSEFIFLKEDPLTNALLKACGNENAPTSEASSNMPALEKLQKENPDLLKRYFASNPYWNTYDTRTRSQTYCVAERRFVETYLTSILHCKNNETATLRTFVGWNNKSRNRVRNYNQTIMRYEKYYTQTQVVCGDLNIEIDEEQKTPSTPLTKVALDFFNKEFENLLSVKNEEDLIKALPKDAVQNGKPYFFVEKEDDRNFYHIMSWVNPGEAGKIYAKAIEINSNKELPRSAISEVREYVGYSKNPENLFFSDLLISICEGQNGQFFGVRFEIWFRPESGAADRKLLEANYKVEGD